MFPYWNILWNVMFWWICLRSILSAYYPFLSVNCLLAKIIDIRIWFWARCRSSRKGLHGDGSLSTGCCGSWHCQWFYSDSSCIPSLCLPSLLQRSTRCAYFYFHEKQFKFVLLSDAIFIFLAHSILNFRSCCDSSEVFLFFTNMGTELWRLLPKNNYMGR